jgi:sugar phosphate isomerase/epimerase
MVYDPTLCEYRAEADGGESMSRRRFLQQLAASLVWLQKDLLRAAPSLKARLGITTDEVSQDFEAALRFAREFGLNWVEIRNLWNQYVTELSLPDVKKARSLLDQYQIRLSVLDTSLYKCALPGTKALRGNKDDYPYQEQDALLRRAIERSELLGSRFIRVFSFWRVENPDTVFDRVVEHLGKSVEMAQKADRVLLLENVGGATAETGAEAARLLKAIPSRNLGLAWDPNNAYCGGEIPFPDGYDCLDKKRVHHVHLRDAGRDPATKRCQWLPVGKGEVDNAGQLRALVKDGFQGTLNLETHYQRPDKNKELASRESLEGLLKIIEKIDNS